MNSLLDLPVAVRIVRVPREDFEMIEDRTAPSAVLLGELHSRRRSEETLRRRALQLNRLLAVPEFLLAAAEVPPGLADHFPIVSGVARAVLAKASHLFLGGGKVQLVQMLYIIQVTRVTHVRGLPRAGY